MLTSPNQAVPLAITERHRAPTRELERHQPGRPRIHERRRRGLDREVIEDICEARLRHPLPGRTAIIPEAKKIAGGTETRASPRSGIREPKTGDSRGSLRPGSGCGSLPLRARAQTPAACRSSAATMMSCTGCADATAAMNAAIPDAGLIRAAETQLGRAPSKHIGSAHEEREEHTPTRLDQVAVVEVRPTAGRADGGDAQVRQPEEAAPARRRRRSHPNTRDRANLASFGSTCRRAVAQSECRSGRQRTHREAPTGAVLRLKRPPRVQLLRDRPVGGFLDTRSVLAAAALDPDLSSELSESDASGPRASTWPPTLDTAVDHRAHQPVRKLS